jgi:periplasmic protein TorT
MVLRALIGMLAMAAAGLGAAQQASAETWRLETWDPPFDYTRPSRVIDYAPLERASRKWTICAAYPHLKDSYWLSVNYGMVDEARRLGVALNVVEAGGYPNLERQRAQVRDCVAAGADVLVLGTVSFSGLSDLVTEVAQAIPVVAAVNDIADDGISAKSGVSWIELGRRTGELLAGLHPKGTAPVNVAWFPGPRGAGWTAFVEEGFNRAVAGSAVDVVVTKWGDTGTEIQLNLIEEAIEEHPDIDYIVGSAVTAEAAVSILRAKGLSEDIRVVADYFTHGVFRGVKRGKIVAAPTDFPVLQGRLAIDQAVRALEGTLDVVHAGPAIVMVTPDNINEVGTEESLAPAWFSPVFTLE